MDEAEAERFAQGWISAWNGRDVEAVLALYDDEVVFTSPTTLAVIGRPTVKGKAELRDYWQRALAQHSTLKFSLERVLWDANARELAIVYTSEINGRSKRVAELFRFGAGALVVETEVFHGLVPT